MAALGGRADFYERGTPVTSGDIATQTGVKTLALEMAQAKAEIWPLLV